MSDSDLPTRSTRGTGSTENVVERLVARCIEDGVETPTGVGDVCRDHPEHVGEVLAQLEALEAAGLFTPPRTDEDFPDSLGDFRLLDRIGSGGMGVVYRARQESLSREVALKLIRPEQLYFPGARERFRREVEAVARMQHPGIVPVHAVGEENGIPYFAMEHVRGCSMDRVISRIRGRPVETLSGPALHAIVCESTGVEPGDMDALFDGSWTEACFRIAGAVADALSHAHERGVLHRDVKPSNVMLTPEGRVMLLDFGVSSAEGASKLTRTGAQVGSLPYMSPEQAAGRLDEIDARADVYSLGVTLYEMLTLRLPYRGRDAAETRALIDEGAPIAPRRLNPHVSWDAETVCLTAMRRERPLRYRTVDALWRDLRNVLEKRTIAARRPGPLRRVRRWVQRNPTTTVAAVLGLLIVVGGPLAFGLREQQVARRLREAGEETAGALAREGAARARAEENLRKACRAVDTLLTRIAEDKMRRLPGLQQLRTTVLADSISFYDELLAENPDNRIVLFGTASSLIKIGDMRQVLGQLERSLEDYSRSRDLYLAIEGAEPVSADIIAGLANVEHNAAYLLDLALARPAEAEERYLRALDWQLELARSGDFRARVDVGITLTNLGALRTRTGRFEEARETLEEALARLEATYAEAPRDGPMLQNLTNALDLLGSLHMDLSHPELAEAYWKEALVVARETWELDPANPGTNQAIVTAIHNLGFVASRTGRIELARTRFEEAVLRAREIVRDHPEIVPFRRTLMQTLNSLGQAWQADPSVEILRVGEAVELGRELVNENPDVPDFRMDLVQGLQNLALAHGRKQDLMTAESCMREAIATFDEAMNSEAARTTMSFRERGAALRGSLGGILLRQRKWDEARPVLEEGLRLWRLIVASGQARMDHKSALGGVAGNLALCNRYRLRFEEAREFALEAIAIQDVALASNPKNPNYRSFMRSHLRELRLAEIELGDFLAAVEAGRRIVELFPEITEMVLQAQLLCDVATRVLEVDPGHAEHRETWLETALDLLERAYESGFRDVKHLETTEMFGILDGEERFLDLLDAMEDEN